MSTHISTYIHTQTLSHIHIPLFPQFCKFARLALSFFISDPTWYSQYWPWLVSMTLQQRWVTLYTQTKWITCIMDACALYECIYESIICVSYVRYYSSVELYHTHSNILFLHMTYTLFWCTFHVCYVCIVCMPKSHIYYLYIWLQH